MISLVKRKTVEPRGDTRTQNGAANQSEQNQKEN
jgi:hypothetical protein